MSEFVRVRDKDTGHHYTVSRERFDQNPDLWQELKQPALGNDGLPRPPKYRVDLGESAAASAQMDAPTKPVDKKAATATTKTAKSADSEKES